MDVVYFGPDTERADGGGGKGRLKKIKDGDEGLAR